MDDPGYRRHGDVGGGVANELARGGADVRGLVRDRAKTAQLLDPVVSIAVGDLDDPASLPGAFDGVDTVFLVSPLDGRIAVREMAVITAAARAGVPRVVKLFGAVEHAGDDLDGLHQASIAALRSSGLRWALVSPNSVMETSLLPHADTIRETGEMYGCSGEGRVGLVAAGDVARAAAVVLISNFKEGANYQLTGPESLSMTQIAAAFTQVLGRPVSYLDMPEDEFGQLLTGAGMTPEQAELGVVAHFRAWVAHFRAWKAGGADLVTDTYRQLTGHSPTSVTEWIAEHGSEFQ